MKKLLIPVFAAILAGCCTNGPKESGTTFARDALIPYVESGELPGAINVFYKDGVQETTCVGYSDVAAKRKITMDDVYMQCSQTKGFCGVTIAKLVEDGKITLDDPVSKYLPEFRTLWVKAGETNGVRTLKRAKNVLTIRMVLNHTGGFPFEIPAKQGNIRGGGWTGGAPLRQTAAIAAACPIMFEPGTKTQYSNTGIDIGAAVVEVVTGMRWEDYLQKNVLDPLGMKDTTFWPTDDQLKFYKMLMNLGVGDNGVRILKEETVKKILAVSTRPTSLGGYSLGLNAPVSDKDDAWFGHGGAWGTNCMVNWHRKELKLWAVQLEGSPRPWDKARAEAERRFFKYAIDNTGADAYTNRVK